MRPFRTASSLDPRRRSRARSVGLTLLSTFAATFASTLVLSFAVASAAGAQADEAAGSEPKGKAPAAKPAGGLLTKPSAAREKAPVSFRVQFDTTKGAFVVEVNRVWSPNGADRFYNLVRVGFYDDIAFFRVIPNFMVQFGIHGEPGINRAWRQATIMDDPVVESNTRGMISFAKTGAPNSRTTQIFINFKDNTNLDAMGFSPFARVVEGMDVVDSIYKIGEGAPRGPGPRQQLIQTQGNSYLRRKFPQLDYIQGAKILD